MTHITGKPGFLFVFVQYPPGGGERERRGREERRKGKGREEGSGGGGREGGESTQNINAIHSISWPAVGQSPYDVLLYGPLFLALLILVSLHFIFEITFKLSVFWTWPPAWWRPVSGLFSLYTGLCSTNQCTVCACFFLVYLLIKLLSLSNSSGLDNELYGGPTLA